MLAAVAGVAAYLAIAADDAEMFDATTAAAPCKFSREPEDEELELFAMLNEKATEFADFLRQKYPEHPMAVPLLRWWNGRVMPSARLTGATWSNGCLVINPYYENVKTRQGNPQTDVVDPVPRLLTRMLHEFAHSTTSSHNAAFYETNRWFLKVATEELGWDVRVTCRVCCFYDAAKGRRPCGGPLTIVCPKCTWIESKCSARKTHNCGAL